MSYKRFSLKSPYGANGEGKERVKEVGCFPNPLTSVIINTILNIFTVFRCRNTRMIT